MNTMILLIVLAIGSNAMVLPRVFTGGLKDLQPNRAKRMMLSWVDELDHRVDDTDTDSYSVYTCLEGIHLIEKRETIVPPFSELHTYSYEHTYRADRVTSHIVLCIEDPVQSSMNVVGIVENPANTIYNKPIVPVMADLTAVAEELECRVNIQPLSQWSGGEFHWTLNNSQHSMY